MEITVQNHYVETLLGKKDNNSEQTSTHVLYGAGVVSDGFSNLYSAPYSIFISILSIMIWQANLSMEWLPIVAISMVIAFIFVVYSSSFMRKAGENILTARQGVMGAVSRDLINGRHEQQKEVFKWEINKRVYSLIIKTLRDWIMWVSIIFVTVVAYLLDMLIMPSSLSLTDLAVLLVNVKLLKGPLGKASHAIMEWQETYPYILNTINNDIKKLERIRTKR